MKRIKRFLGVSAWLAVVVFMICSCSDDLDVKQAYSYDLETMPVPKKVSYGETIEIRCRLILEGEYKDAKFFIRYFQPDGKGTLKMEDGTVLKPNDSYSLNTQIFRLFYTSLTRDQQSIDVYIEDNFGQILIRNFQFQGDNVEEKKE